MSALPPILSPDHQMARVETPLAPPLPTRGRILVVDDESDLRDVSVEILRAAGFSANGVGTAAQALTALPRVQPDLILLDINLPDVNGLELCHQLRANPAFASVAILHLSGDRISSEEQAAGLEAGADGYIARPLSNHELVARVEAILRVKRTEAELRRVTAELRTASRTLEQSEQRYKCLFEHNPDAVCSIDLEGRFLTFNAAFETLTGYRGEELHLAPFQRLLAPEDIASVEQTFARTIRGEPTACELTFFHRDGSRRLVQASSLPIFVDGRIIGIFAVAQDVMERRESEERFRQLAENVDDAFWILDVATQRMLYVNPAFQKICGFPDGPLNPDPFPYPRSVDLQDQERVVRAFEEAPDAVNIEYRVPQSDGTVRWNWARTFPIHNAQGRLYRIAGIARDITERKHLEAQFLRAQRMESIGTLAGGIAHDLNNVLSPILMAIDLLKLKNQDAGEHDILDTMETSARRGADMIRQVLSFARGVEGQRLIVQPRYLIKEIEKIVVEAFPKNIELTLTHEPDLWNVLGDSTQLHQVLINLCVNARDAMPEGGRIRISVANITLDEHYVAMNIESRVGPHVVIEVRDTGTGMPAEIMEKIFDPFFTTKEIGKGTGLGLSTSMAIVKSHGGFLRVSSEPGSGSTFQVHLPAHFEMPELVNELAPSPLPRGHGELIMVVDDESSIRTVARQTLQAFGYRVLLAVDGVEAVALYAQQQVEIAAVLTDMMMPVMDGPAMIQVLACMNPQVKIIAASGLSSSSQVADFAVVKDFLPKPYTADALLRTLASVLAANA